MQALNVDRVQLQDSFVALEEGIELFIQLVINRFVRGDDGEKVGQAKEKGESGGV